MSEHTHSHLSENISRFQFLCTIPPLNLTPALLDDDCVICKEPYYDWQHGGTLHRPVALPCGHRFGFRCLARWTMSPHFANSCPLCRAEIVSRVPTPTAHLSRALATSTARLEMLGVVAEEGISAAQKRQLLFWLRGLVRAESAPGIPTDQIMGAWEEVLGSMCRDAVAPAPGEQNPPDSEFGRLLERSTIRVLVWIFIILLAYVPTGLVMWRFGGALDTVSSMVLCTATWLGSFIGVFVVLNYAVELCGWLRSARRG